MQCVGGYRLSRNGTGGGLIDERSGRRALAARVRRAGDDRRGRGSSSIVATRRREPLDGRGPDRVAGEDAVAADDRGGAFLGTNAAGVACAIVGLDAPLRRFGSVIA